MRREPCGDQVHTRCNRRADVEHPPSAVDPAGSRPSELVPVVHGLRPPAVVDVDGSQAHPRTSAARREWPGAAGRRRTPARPPRGSAPAVEVAGQAGAGRSARSSSLAGTPAGCTGREVTSARVKRRAIPRNTSSSPPRWRAWAVRQATVSGPTGPTKAGTQRRGKGILKGQLHVVRHARWSERGRGLSTGPIGSSIRARFWCAITQRNVRCRRRKLDVDDVVTSVTPALRYAHRGIRSPPRRRMWRKKGIRT